MTFQTDVLSILSTNWNCDNTKNITPLIGERINYKRISGESILLYDVSDTEQDNCSGGQSKSRSMSIGLQITSFKTQEHRELYIEEIRRIFNSPTFQTYPFSGENWDFQDITEIRRGASSVGYYPCNIIMKFEQLNKVYDTI